MRFSFTLECTDKAELSTVQNLLAYLMDHSGGVADLKPAGVVQSSAPLEPVADVMVQPAPAAAAEEPKPRRTKPKLVQAESTGNGHAEGEIDNALLLKMVGDFCARHKNKNDEISAMLKNDFGVERITQLNMGQRKPFLAKLEALATEGPEAA